MPFILLLLFPEPAFTATVYVNNQSINIRSGPGLEHTVIAVLKIDRPLKMLGETMDWLNVLIPSGKKGWISRKMVTTEKPTGLVIEEYKETLNLQRIEIEKLKKELSATNQANEQLSFESNELKLNHDQLIKDNEKLKKAKETIWIIGSIIAALLIWLMGFLAGHFRVARENKRLHEMTTLTSINLES